MSDRWRRLGLILFGIWALLFLCGAAGEILGIDWLRDWTDFKRLFLR